MFYRILMFVWILSQTFNMSIKDIHKTCHAEETFTTKETFQGSSNLIICTTPLEKSWAILLKRGLEQEGIETSLKVVKSYEDIVKGFHRGTINLAILPKSIVKIHWEMLEGEIDTQELPPVYIHICMSSFSDRGEVGKLSDLENKKVSIGK